MLHPHQERRDDASDIFAKNYPATAKRKVWIMFVKLQLKRSARCCSHVDARSLSENLRASVEALTITRSISKSSP